MPGRQRGCPARWVPCGQYAGQSGYAGVEAEIPCAASKTKVVRNPPAMIQLHRRTLSLPSESRLFEPLQPTEDGRSFPVLTNIRNLSPDPAG